MEDGPRIRPGWVMTEHDRFDVQVRHSFHGPPGLVPVVAVQATRKAGPAESGLQGVADEQQSVPWRVEADRAPRVCPGT